MIRWILLTVAVILSLLVQNADDFFAPQSVYPMEQEYTRELQAVSLQIKKLEQDGAPAQEIKNMRRRRVEVRWNYMHYLKGEPMRLTWDQVEEIYAESRER